MSENQPRVADDQIRDSVRDAYGAIARGDSGCCGGAADGQRVTAVAADRLGYATEDVSAVPEGANLGLGCGNPGAIARMKPGETVLDLGSGAGFDCFLAARAVGPTGHVIGVDMTPDMVSKARKAAQDDGYAHVDFRLGEIEHLPVADGSVDVIISNCVINLSPNKPAVFADAMRVLKPGGRLAIADVVATAEVPADVQRDMAMHCGCIAGAAHIDEVTAMLEQAGFVDIAVTPKDESREFMRDWTPGTDPTDYVVSAEISARKPTVEA